MMKHSKHPGVLFAIAILLVNVASFTTLSLRSQCTYVPSAKGYDCIRLDLTGIPQTLSNKFETLHISVNRIRELNGESFRKYPEIRELYLNDNMIQNIAEDTFEYLPNLEILDLSFNSLVTVPVYLLHIETLRVLSLANNKHLNTEKLFNMALPIKSPLERLDLSCTLMTQMPRLELLSSLTHFNITGNNITNVSKEDLLPLCNLKYFYNYEMMIDFHSECDCVQIVKWFNYLSIKSRPEFHERCDKVSFQKCETNANPTASEVANQEKCITEYKKKVLTQKAVGIFIIVAIAVASLASFCGICYLYHRWQRLDDPPAPHEDENENTELNIKKKTAVLRETILLNHDE